MTTERSKQPLQSSASDSQAAPVSKDFITANTEKLYREMGERIANEAALNGYIAIQDDYRRIDECYSFLCGIAALAGLSKPENCTEKKHAELEKAMSTADYKEFICLYNVFTSSEYDDAVAEILLNGTRKKEAAAAFMYHTFRTNTDEQTRCLAYEEYLSSFGCSKQLAAELFARWEYAASKCNDACAEKYYGLAKKCCGGNHYILSPREVIFLDASHDEMRIAGYYLAGKEAVSNSFSKAVLAKITDSLEKTDASNFCNYTKDRIADCIISTVYVINSTNTADISSELLDRFSESVATLEGLDATSLFSSLFEIWLEKAKANDHKGADICFSILHKLAPGAVANGVNITAEQLDFATNGNCRTGANVINLREKVTSTTQISMSRKEYVKSILDELEKIDFPSECTYIQDAAKDCADGLFNFIRIKRINNNEFDALRNFALKNQGYNDICYKIDELNRNSYSNTQDIIPITHNLYAVSNTLKPSATSPKKTVNNKPSVSKDSSKSENAEKTLGPVYLLQMILGFILISLSFTDMGYTSESEKGVLTALLVGALIVYVLVSVISVVSTAKNKQLVPGVPMIIIESVLITACFMINTFILTSSGAEDIPSAAGTAFAVIFIANLIIKIKSRKL